MAHTFLALRAGGIVNFDDLSPVSSVADRGQSSPDAGAAQFVPSGAGMTSGQASALLLPQADFSLAVSQAVVVPNFSPAVSAPVVVNDAHAPLELRAGGADVSTDSAASSESSTLLSLNQHFLDNGWFIVPSADNEYGPVVYAAGDGFGWDASAGEFSADWFVV